MKTNRKSLTSVLLDSCVYIIYIVWKCFTIKFWSLQSLHAKQERKARQRLNFLPVSKARTNKCYIFRQCTCIVYAYICIDTIVNCISLLTKYLLKKKSCFINKRFKISKAENREVKKYKGQMKKKIKSNNSRQNTTQKTKDFQKTFVKKKRVIFYILLFVLSLIISVFH